MTPEPATSAVVHLTRHAHAVSRSRWQQDDALRPLSATGTAQAEALGHRLAATAPAALLSSRALRCRATLEPLAVATGLPVEDDEQLYEGAGGDRALARLLEAAAVRQPLVACTHGDVLGAVLEALAGGGTALRSPLAVPKAGTWELTVVGGAVTEARLVPPPSA